MGLMVDNPDIAEYLQLFIFTTWDYKYQLIKQAIAWYTVRSKSTGPDLSNKLSTSSVNCISAGLLLIRCVAMVLVKMFQH